MISKKTLPILLVAIFFACQGGFWWNTRNKLPEMGIVPDIPSKTLLQALSLGDDETLFRLLAFQLGNAGDTFGRTTALRDYKLEKVRDWFLLLDEFDKTSDLLPSLSAYYFAQTQNSADLVYVVDYLYKHSFERPEKKWWWLVQAGYLAQHKLKDSDLALKVVKPLETTKDIPQWAQQQSAFIHEKRGEFNAALQVMKGIIDSSQNIPEKELVFMRYFIEERLKKMEELDKATAAKLPEFPVKKPAEKKK